MVSVTIEATPRTELGKKAAAAIRKDGGIPAVIYSKNGVEHFTTNSKAVKSLVYTPDFKLAEIQLNGATHKAILKEIVFHPVTDEIEHIDFLELVEGHPIKASIPVKFKGVSPGVKAGGKLITTMRSIKIKATPENLVDELYVDISSLELGEAVRVRDVETPEGVEILVDGATPVANVEIPRALKSAAAKQDAESEGA
ncbi:MAG: 50S ribosomal protein L25 [Bacteroidota bacterium]